MPRRPLPGDPALLEPLNNAYPRDIEADQAIDKQVSLVDIFPTILALVGKKPLEELQGFGLLPYLKMRESERR